MLTYAFGFGRRVPLLGWADLGFHELGHMVFRLMGETVSFIMGSGTQALVPMGLAGYFWWSRRDLVSTGVMLGWGAASLQDVSVYMADAPYERLQLIGGDHDWAHLFHTWDMMHRAEAVAGFVWFVGLMVGMAALAACGWPIVKRMLAEHDARRHRNLASRLPVREARRAAADRD